VPGASLSAASFCMLLALSGCQSGREDETLRRKVDELSLKVDSLIYALEAQRENDSITIDESIVFMKPADSGVFIKTKVAFLTASIDSFRDFGSGSRVTFRIGNPSSVTLKGMRARLEWYVRPDRGEPEFMSPVLYEFLEDLPPGKMTKITILIDDVPASRMLGVRVARVRFSHIEYADSKGLNAALKTRR
jgi:hypothetical protein